MRLNTLAICLFMLVISTSETVFADVDKGPENIDLMKRFDIDGRKKPVVFPHRKHQEGLECVKCHQKEDGGELLTPISQKDTISNDFHRKVCWPCHDEMKVPLGKKCPTCHK